MPEGVLRPPVLTLQSELPPLPSQTLAAAHANALELLKIKTATSQDLRKGISDLERFNGEIGELNHFLKGGDRLMARIEVKTAENLIDSGDAEALKAALVCRVKRSILNLIQADEETPWAVVKDRLKKAFGGGRWTPEEDIFLMFREKKQPNQTNGQYASALLIRYNKITEKMRETVDVAEVEARMAFLSTILKVQLAKDTGRKEGLPRDKTFLECAQEMVDASARDEEARDGEEEIGWTRATYRRVRTKPPTWRRKEAEDSGRERGLKRHERERRSWKKEERKCHGCGKAGHLVAQCPRTKCYECGTEGHIARQCPYMRRRREVNLGEPMEVNAQRVWRRSRSPVESVGSTESSETEEEASEPENRRGEGETSGKGRRGHRTTAARRARREE